MREDLLKIPERLDLSPQNLVKRENLEALAGDMSLFLAENCDYGTRTDVRVKSSILEYRYNTSGGMIRKAVRLARRKGVFIVGTRQGYYYGCESVDGNKIKDDLIARIMSMGKTLGLMSKRSGYKVQLDLRFEKGRRTEAFNLADYYE